MVHHQFRTAVISAARHVQRWKFRRKLYSLLERIIVKSQILQRMWQVYAVQCGAFFADEALEFRTMVSQKRTHLVFKARLEKSSTQAPPVPVMPLFTYFTCMIPRVTVYIGENNKKISHDKNFRVSWSPRATVAFCLFSWLLEKEMIFMGVPSQEKSWIHDWSSKNHTEGWHFN